MAVFFYKEIVSNKFIVDGAPVPFEILDGNRGVIKLEENEANAKMIAELNKSAGRFGIVKINETEFNEKKTALDPLGRSERISPLKDKLRVVQTRVPRKPFGSQVSAPAAEVNPPNGEAQVAMSPPPNVKPLEPSPFLKELAKPGPPIEQAAEPVPAAAPEAPAPEAQPTPKFTPATRRISRRTEQPAT
jgi:hypothetical protein